MTGFSHSLTREWVTGLDHHSHSPEKNKSHVDIRDPLMLKPIILESEINNVKESEEHRRVCV